MKSFFCQSLLFLSQSSLHDTNHGAIGKFLIALGLTSYCYEAFKAKTTESIKPLLLQAFWSRAKYYIEYLLMCNNMNCLDKSK